MQKWLAAIVLLLTACTDAGVTRRKTLDITHPASHAIQSAQLRELMDRMDILMQERFMTEHEVDIERRKYATRMASAAENLSKTVKAILELLPSLKLDAKDQNAFLFLANQLDNQAQALQKQARQNQIDAIGDTMNQISATCTTCHSLFRKPNP
ncbi:MAG: cytochrome c [Gammaproteobacteria bacterium]